MKNINDGIDVNWVLKLKERHGLVNFIETGTYLANSTLLVAEHFDKLYTIEYDIGVFYKAKDIINKSKHSHKIVCFHGSSAHKLGHILSVSAKPSLLWLDAHYSCGFGLVYPEGGECPVLEEIEHINHSVKSTGMKHAIMIDDARMFTKRPSRKAHKVKDWPTFDQIVDRLGKLWSVNIIDDVIVCEQG